MQSITDQLEAANNEIERLGRLTGGNASEVVQSAGKSTTAGPIITYLGEESGFRKSKPEFPIKLIATFNQIESKMEKDPLYQKSVVSAHALFT